MHTDVHTCWRWRHVNWDRCRSWNVRWLAVGLAEVVAFWAHCMRLLQVQLTTWRIHTAAESHRQDWG